MEASKPTAPAGGRLFGALCKLVVSGASAGCLSEDALRDIEAKAMLLPGSSPGRRAQIANMIHDRCIEGVSVSTRQALFDALARLRRRFVHAGRNPDLMRLHGALLRFTHSESFFNVCMPTVRVTLAMLVAYVLVGELMQAVDMVDAVERVIYRRGRHMASELADLLELKYGLVNLAQYKLIPGLLDETANCCDDVVRAGAPGGDACLGAEEIAEMEAVRLLEMPVRSSALSRLCDFMVRRGASTAHAAPEFVAGLKIEEVSDEEAVAAVKAAENAGALDAARMALDVIQKRGTGEALDGSVTSPLGAVGASPFDGVTLQKFVLLEYLHIMKMLANCIAQRSSGEKIRMVVNTCPFRTTTAAPAGAAEPPADASRATPQPDSQARSYQQRLQSRPITGPAMPPLFG
ncbi:putative virion core protein [Parapoxvirus red deer/HL953]|uniref:Assembly protein G7 n=1 Tax=Parapoxvirus red deer/HL953 TaxID=1579460 RepID=A0A0A7M9Q8_9POXV|nr:putative virion core protein [Parapoxvirus red deer/HL953]AIZ77295.1 putative virion core protein [Parapoxvirus red deer/HL953]